MKIKILLLVIGCWFSVFGYAAETPSTTATVIQPAATMPATVAPEVPLAKGEKISLDLQGVDINELFKVLSAKSGLTIITTPGVQGRVASVFVNNLSFEDALDVIITKQNLAYEKRGNLIKVMTPEEYEATFGVKFGERKETKTIKLNYAKPSNITNIISTLKSQTGKIISDEPSGTLIITDSPPVLSLIEQTIKELDQPLQTAVFDINYARSADIKSYLNELITPGVGQVIIDDRSSKAIVSDLPQRLAKITRLMKEFDEASRQVLINGEIIQVTLTDATSSGINWGKLFTNPKMAGLDLVGNWTIPLSSYQQVSIGTVGHNSFTAVMNFLAQYGETKILSSPRIVAVNKEEATILVGTREAYITETLSQAQTTTVNSENVQFIDVGVKLKVVPTIGKDGYITMKIKPEVSTVASVLTTAAGSQIPIVDTSQAETVVKVKDGTMIMIAGLMQDTKQDTITGEPVLSRIPILGALFGSRVKSNPRKELVIFLTPQLISGAESDKSEEKIEVKNPNDKIPTSK